jgi:hypothetical protein
MLGSTAALLVGAGLLVSWLQLNVSGFRLVLARGWHGARPSFQLVPRQVTFAPEARIAWCVPRASRA